MRRSQTSISVVVLALAGFLSLVSVPPSFAAEGVAVERLGAGSLSIEPQVAFERAVLKVSGPQGYALRRSFEAGGPITVELFSGSLPIEGRYKYEVLFTELSGDVRVFSGLFFVQEGSVLSREAMRGRLSGIHRDLAGLARDERWGMAVERMPSPPGVTYVHDSLQIWEFYPDGSTYLFLQSAFSSDWGIRNDFGDIRFREYDGSGFQDHVTIEQGGEVGFGTVFPGADVEIYDFASYSAMRLNNGTANWAFSNTPSGVFTVNKIGSGGQEFAVRPRFDAAGNTLQVQGSVQGTKFVASSSRDLKTDFRVLDGKEVLAKLSEMSLMSWRYKTDDKADRHFGPVAEDFQAAFQLGDGKTIANIDADGVALAAIQGLYSLLEEKTAALEKLRAERDQEIADLTKRLAALEGRLQAQMPSGS